MGIFARSHARRAAMFVLGLAWLATAADAGAGTLLSPGAAYVVKKSAEPFGRPADRLTDGVLRDKWLGVERMLADEMVQIALCDGDRENCVSPAALRFLAIVDAARQRDGRARLGEINRAINLAIRPVSDLAQYGRIDVWASPLVALARGAGDCEDYAIAKFAALRLAGVAPEVLRIVITHDTVRGEDHAVAAARLDGRWMMLDNRRMAMVEDSDVRNDRPTYLIDQHGVMKYADAPLVVAATTPDLKAPVVSTSTIRSDF